MEACREFLKHVINASAHVMMTLLWSMVQSPDALLTFLSQTVQTLQTPSLSLGPDLTAGGPAAWRIMQQGMQCLALRIYPSCDGTNHPREYSRLFLLCSYVFLRFSPPMCGGPPPPPFMKCTCVLLIWTDHSWWQAMTAGSCPQLCSAPSPGRVSEDCTVNTHQLRPNCRHRRTLTLGAREHPPPPLLAIRDSVYHMLWPETSGRPGHQPLSGHSHHVHPLRHLDGRFLQGRRIAVVRKCWISLLFIISVIKRE